MFGTAFSEMCRIVQKMCQYCLYFRSLEQNNSDANGQQNKLQPAVSEAITELQLVKCNASFVVGYSRY